MDFILVSALVAAWLLIFLSWVACYKLIVQNGQILLRLDVLERRVDHLDPDEFRVEQNLTTLPVGVAAPSIDLPDLSGTLRSLAEWRGRRVLLVFFDPQCIFSNRLLPYLVALTTDPVPERPVPVVVSTGDLETNRLLFHEAGFTQSVLLQANMAVAVAYKVDATPMSYLIEPDGTIGSEVAAGIQDIMVLAGEIAPGTGGMPAPNHLGRPARVIRDGLKEGSAAPLFRLPTLEGSELSLLAYRGREVVIVFSDPECEPCENLFPVLEELQTKTPDLALVMVSRGSVEANRAMVARHRPSFPLALQQHWEISRQYGIVAAPAAFHIDEWGLITSEVAVGPEAIAELVIRAASASVQVT
jgi:peroxiredoxin